MQTRCRGRAVSYNYISVIFLSSSRHPYHQKVPQGSQAHCRTRTIGMSAPNMLLNEKSSLLLFFFTLLVPGTRPYFLVHLSLNFRILLHIPHVSRFLLHIIVLVLSPSSYTCRT